MKNNVFQVLLIALWLISCSESKTPTWTFKELIPLDSISPVGITTDGTNLWLADPDNNRIVKIGVEGNLLKEVTNLQRPMHIAFSDERLYVPEYLTDTIRIIENKKSSFLLLSSQLNAPAGISINGSTFAIADFYNHRVILKTENKELIIGKEGHNQGELYYPTDIAIHEDLIYVADAYNNRVQVFDFQGTFVKMIGWKEGIDVATGLTVTDAHVFVTDYEGNRVLVFNLDGKLIQKLTKQLNKPTDIEVLGCKMYVVNYSGHNISVFDLF